MRSHTKYLTVKVPERMAFVNLTRRRREGGTGEWRSRGAVPGKLHAYYLLGLYQ